MTTKSDLPGRDISPTYIKVEEESPPQKNLITLLRQGTRASQSYVQHHAWPDYVKSLGLVVLASILGQPFGPMFDHANMVMFYLLAEVIAAIRYGLGPSIVAALGSVIAFHFFFIPPHFTFAIGEAQYLLTFMGLLIVGLVISTLTARVREQAKAAQRREAQTAVLYHFSRDLAEAAALEAINQAIKIHIKQVFNGEAIILLAAGEKLSAHAFNADDQLSEQEHAIATWCFHHGQPAGWGTPILPAASRRYHPLKTAQSVVGVLGIRPAGATAPLLPAQHQLLETSARQAAVAIERIQLADQAQQTQLLSETEKLQTALLNSISHDLRTPLASITGVLSSLHEDAQYLDEKTKHELVENAWEEANRLNRLVANLLDMTRLQTGGVKVVRAPCDVQDLVGTVLAELAARLQARPVTVSLPAELPLVPIDFVLISRVLINLLDNADKYSPSGIPIEIRARVIDPWVEIAVADHGSGIPPKELGRIFEKFYQVQRPDRASGTGLGLSICKGIVEVHGGRIWAENRPEGGAIITVQLPLSQVETKAAEVKS